MSRRAFTLIELLIIVAVIATLASIAVPNFLEAQVRAKVGRTRTDLMSVVVGLRGYYADETKYPANNSPAYFVGCATAPATVTPAAPPPTSAFSAMLGPRTLPPSMNAAWRVSGNSLICLTTPIAYAGGVLPVDSFADLRGSFFCYANTGAVRDQVPLSQRAQVPPRFLLLSWGPNTDQASGGDCPNPILGPFLTYDPTNGTISDGDLLMTGEE